MATLNDLNNDPSILSTLSGEEVLALWNEYENADEKEPLGGTILQQLAGAAWEAAFQKAANQDATVEDHNGEPTADPQSPESAG